MSELKKRLDRIHLPVLQAMCTKKNLGISAKSEKKGTRRSKNEFNKRRIN